MLFVISLSEFNLVLYEDDTTNRMAESLHLFEEILNSVFFKSTSFIVFFNKVDLFQEKLRSVKLVDHCPDFQGPNEYKEAV